MGAEFVSPQYLLGCESVRRIPEWDVAEGRNIDLEMAI
jgi:hypothetical protein